MEKRLRVETTYFRETNTSKSVLACFASSEDQLADLFTKNNLKSAENFLKKHGNMKNIETSYIGLVSRAKVRKGERERERESCEREKGKRKGGKTKKKQERKWKNKEKKQDMCF